ncbi:MAG: endolytic transglycosylase MltG [Clostridia bacterium]|nr:endolytic transglycosylase MltG [Clostridia bacterium]
MDDRFRSEDTASGSVPPHITKSNSLGDFSENVQSTRGRATPTSASAGHPRAGKFRVNLPEEAASIPDFTVSSDKKPEPLVKEVTGKEYLESIQRRNASVQQTRINLPVNEVKSQNQMQTQTKKEVAAENRNSVKGKSMPKTAAPAVKKAVVQRPARTAAPAKKSAKKKKYDFINSVLVACVCIIFISILTVTASTVAMTTINDILVIDKSGSDDYISVYIPPEATEYEQVFEIIKDAGLIKQPLVTNIFCKFRHYDEVRRLNSETEQYETVRIKYSPGTYFLNSEMGIESILEEIMVSSSGYKDTVRLTFPEGWTIAQIFRKIEKYGVCEADKLYANLDIIGDQYEFISKIEASNGRYLDAEGYLFPDTYDFFIGENAGSVLKKLFNNFESKWKDEYAKRLKELDMSLDDIINIASVIQREAKDVSQMDVISSVIHNRLRESATYPTIGMNSTKDYILSLKEFNVLSDFYYNLYLNSYNTYSSEGLPPGPICNPGAAAIRAALYPDDTDYYFFCHNDTGDIFLAKTYSEHQANTEKVLYGG